MPVAREAIRGRRQANGEADGAVGGDDLKDDVKGRIRDGIAFEGRGFGDSDEEDGEDDPPEVVGELTA